MFLTDDYTEAYRSRNDDTKADLSKEYDYGGKCKEASRSHVRYRKEQITA